MANETEPRVADLMVPATEAVHPDHPLREAMARLEREETPILPVVDADELVGVITGPDVRGETSPWRIDPGRAAVRDVMSADLDFCYERDSLTAIRQIFDRTGHRHLPVLNEDRELTGFIALDAVRQAVETAAIALPKRDLPTGERHVETAGRASAAAQGRRTSYRVHPTLRPPR